MLWPRAPRVLSRHMLLLLLLLLMMDPAATAVTSSQVSKAERLPLPLALLRGPPVQVQLCVLVTTSRLRWITRLPIAYSAHLSTQPTLNEAWGQQKPHGERKNNQSGDHALTW